MVFGKKKSAKKADEMPEPPQKESVEEKEPQMTLEGQTLLDNINSYMKYYQEVGFGFPDLFKQESFKLQFQILMELKRSNELLQTLVESLDQEE